MKDGGEMASMAETVDRLYRLDFPFHHQPRLSQALSSGSFSTSGLVRVPVIIFQTRDIVFFQVIPRLHLDNLQGLDGGIF